jgi:hypothetical protein
MPEIESFLPDLPQQAPKFAIRQRVQLYGIGDDGVTYHYEGFVTGIFYDPSWHFPPGWCYIVAFYYLSYNHGMTLPCFEPAHEMELKAIAS